MTVLVCQLKLEAWNHPSRC